MRPTPAGAALFCLHCESASKSYDVLSCAGGLGVAERWAEVDGIHRPTVAPSDECQALEVVAMGLFGPTYPKPLALVPDVEAKIVFEKFHLACLVAIGLPYR